MRRKHNSYTGILLSMVLILPMAQAQEQPEAWLSGEYIGGCGFLTYRRSVLEWTNPDGGVAFEAPSHVATAPGQPVFATLEGDIVTIRLDGTHVLSHTLFSAGPFGALAVAPSGRVFARTSNSSVARISPSGAVEASYPLPGLHQDNQLLAVAHDGCTVFYPKLFSIGRVNGCTGAELPDFAPVSSTFLNDMEPRPNGDVLVANGGQVQMYDSAGSMIRTIADIEDYGFDPTELMADEIAVRPDGQVLWLAVMPGCDFNSPFLLRVSMSDGRELSRRETGLNSANGLVVSEATAADIPTAGTTALVTLALLLAFGGALLVRR